MLVNILIAISIFFVLLACFLEMTGRRRVSKIPKSVFWMLGLYLAVIAVFVQGQGSIIPSF